MNAEMTKLEQIKLAAQNEVNKEVFDKAKTELVKLYRKLADAEKIVQNVKNEISDYEMQVK